MLCKLSLCATTSGEDKTNTSIAIDVALDNTTISDSDSTLLTISVDTTTHG